MCGGARNLPELLKAEGKFREILQNQISEDSAGAKLLPKRDYKDA